MINLKKIKYFYQPIYNVEAKVFDKVELLLRINDKNGQFMNTEKFIAKAEVDGFIKQIDCCTFLQACKMLPKFQFFGVQQISVNLSPVTCKDPNIVLLLKEILIKTNTNPASICLEITEMADGDNIDNMSFTISELSKLGFSIAIDDFGKGYSGLTRMLSFPVNVLKLDKSLVDKIGDQSMASSLVRSIVHFAKFNGLSVTAEGVENNVSMQQLIDLKCNNLQGFYFSRPVSQDFIFERLGKLSQM